MRPWKTSLRAKLLVDVCQQTLAQAGHSRTDAAAGQTGVADSLRIEHAGLGVEVRLTGHPCDREAKRPYPLFPVAAEPKPTRLEFDHELCLSHRWFVEWSWHLSNLA